MAETIYAVIDNGTVVNTIVADAAFIATYYPAAVRIDALAPVPGIGWSYDGARFTSAPMTASMTFDGATLTLPAGATLQSLKSADGATTYVLTTDYTVAGTAITQVSGGALTSGQKVLATYTLSVATQ